jgi:hypothetical protein
MRVALVVLLSVGCASSEIPDDYTPSGETGAETAAADTGTAKTDTGSATDTTIEDSAMSDAEPLDTGAATDAEFPDFGGGGDAPMFPESGFGTMCMADSECMSPFNCCEPTKKTCGFKFGAGACMTF